MCGNDDQKETSNHYEQRLHQCHFIIQPTNQSVRWWRTASRTNKARSQQKTLYNVTWRSLSHKILKCQRSVNYRKHMRSVMCGFEYTSLNLQHMTTRESDVQLLVSVCVWEREFRWFCVCERESLGGFVCVCVCVRERETEFRWFCVCERERESSGGFVCVCERERERQSSWQS